MWGGPESQFHCVVEGRAIPPEECRPLDQFKQISDENLGNFYTRFNTELESIDQVITGGETNHTFMRVLRPKGTTLYGSLSVIPVNTVEARATRVKSYIDLEIVKEGRKMITNRIRKTMKENAKAASSLECA